MKILITGLGVTGKSSFLLELEELLKILNIEAIALDLDYQRELLPQEFNVATTYILEDVHGPTPQAVVPLKEFDLVFYLLPSWSTHLKFWLNRMLKWFENGKYAWDADKEHGKWAGTEKSKDLRNVPGILKYFWSHFPKRGVIIKEDLTILKASKITTIIVIPSKGGSSKFFAYKMLAK